MPFDSLMQAFAGASRASQLKSLPLAVVEWKSWQQALAIDAEWLAGKGHWSDKIGEQRLQVTHGSSGEVSAELDGSPVTITRMYWFAWYTFHLQTALIDASFD